MPFNSILFLAFFALVYPAYFLIKKWEPAKVYLLIVSYVFYGWWNPIIVFVILYVSVISQAFGVLIARTANVKVRKRTLVCALVFVLAPLFYYKYAQFTLNGLQSLIGFWGGRADFVELNVILPIGISFYTFHGISYLLDLHRGEARPVKAVDLYLYIAFFPHLIAGPIIRASDFIPQLRRRSEVNSQNVLTAINRIAEGFFLKMVVSDNLSIYVDQIFFDHAAKGATYWFGAMLFAVQIFSDFAGYSQIARGLALLFGFNFPLNFDYPYIARGFHDFWNRWHISLSHWFRDYVYKPLGGNRRGERRTYVNGVLTLVLSGLWHGANLTFVFWGVLHGIFWAAERLFKRHFPKAFTAPFFAFPKTLLTFICVCLAWVFFRAETHAFALQAVAKMLNPVDFWDSALLSAKTVKILIFVSPVVLLHVYGALKERGYFVFKAYDYVSGALLILALYFQGSAHQFIYFRF